MASVGVFAIFAAPLPGPITALGSPSPVLCSLPTCKRNHVKQPGLCAAWLATLSLCRQWCAQCAECPAMPLLAITLLLCFCCFVILSFLGSAALLLFVVLRYRLPPQMARQEASGTRTPSAAHGRRGTELSHLARLAVARKLSSWWMGETGQTARDWTRSSPNGASL